MVTIRIAAKADLDALIRLETHFDSDRLTKPRLQHFIQSKTATFLIVQHGDTIIGSALILFRRNSTIGRLYSIVIDPHFRGQGIAQQLYQAIEAAIRQRQGHEIRLEVKKSNQQAINFYFKNGLEVFGEYKKFYEDGEDALRMRKHL